MLHSQLILHHEDHDYRFLRTAETPELLHHYCEVCSRTHKSIVVTVIGEDEPRSGFGLWERIN